MATEQNGTITDNTATSIVTTRARSYSSEGVYVEGIGTWDGATISVEKLGLDGTWRGLPNGSFTADFAKLFKVPNGRQIRIQPSGTGGSTSIDWELDCMSDEG